MIIDDDDLRKDKIIFREVMWNDTNMQKEILWVDAQCFPDDSPVSFKFASFWWIGYLGIQPVCHAAWRPHVVSDELNPLHAPDVWGFLYRAAVLPSVRGKGLQKRMIKLREDDMRKRGITHSVTYTQTYSIASMKSLMAAGYTPYETTKATNLAGEDRAAKFVHWEKNLGR